MEKVIRFLGRSLLWVVGYFVAFVLAAAMNSMLLAVAVIFAALGHGMWTVARGLLRGIGWTASRMGLQPMSTARRRSLAGNSRNGGGLFGTCLFTHPINHWSPCNLFHGRL